ncbi:hypothetical protein B6D60_09075 [candidate division KSB1 bacterium 4484_87]|nr:MAG: hypothetical protein B6D60_09075 [candidate division KSB1 bacterium 4484_87]
MYRNLTFSLMLIIWAFAFCQQESAIQQTDRPFTVVIDAGHGGSDPGAIGFNGIKEKDIVLEVAKKCQNILADEKINVILTRTQDKFVRLNDRILFINKTNPDLVISLHVNVSRDSMLAGIDSYINDDKHAATMDSIFGEQFNQVSLETHRMGGRAKFSILKLVKAPVVYLELGYMSNREDCSKLNDAKQKNILAETIAESVLNFFKIRE